MKKLFYLLFAVLIYSHCFAQTLEIKWQQCYGGSEDDVVYDIIPYGDGYLVAGGTASEDGDISFSHGSSEFWIIKIDSVGDLLWEKTFGGSSGEFCTRILNDLDNSFYLIGNSVSSDGDISYDPYPGSNDIWVVKFDSAGNILWDKIIGGGMIDAIESATLTQDGGVAVFGWTGSQTGDVSVNYGMYDMWLVKLNSEGEIVWDKSFGTDDFDYGQAMISTSDGGFLIGGASTIGSEGNLTCGPFNFNAEAVLLKLDSFGNIEWQNCYGGSDSDGIWGMKELNDGYLIAAYGNSNDGDLSGSGWHGEADIWIIKIDINGNIIWQKCYGGSSDDYARNIFESESDSFVIIGKTQSQNGDITNNHSISEYDNDIWFLKIDSVGEIINQKCFGGIGNEFIYGGALQKSDYNYIIAAYMNYGPSYDVACAPHGSLGIDTDYWVFEIDSLDTSGVIENNYENVIKVYPNPAREFVVFQLTPPYPSRQGGTGSQGGNCSGIMITDIFGQEVVKLRVKQEKTVWDCREVKDGIYFYWVEIDGKVQAGKVVVRRK